MMRRPILACALLGLVLFALAPRAAAYPFTAHFADLIDELNQRDIALPETDLTKEQRRQRATINRAFHALVAPSTDLAGDMKMARRVAVALEAGFPGDGTISTLLSSLDDDLLVEVGNVRDEVVVTLSLAEPGRLHDRAQAKIDDADALLAEADAAATEALRARLQERAHRTLLAANRLALRAGPGNGGGGSSMAAVVDGGAWQSNSDFGTAVTGSADVSTANDAPRRITVVGRRTLPSGGNPNLPGDSSRIQLSFYSNNQDIVVGSYVTGTSSGVNSSASWIEELEGGSSSQAVATSGSFEITSLTVRAGSIDVEGTFDVTMYDGIADVSFTVASGTFQAFGLPRLNVP
jgi:hypothetical protein